MAVASTMRTTVSPSIVRSSHLYCSGSISTPIPAATLTQAVLMVVGRKNAMYSSTLERDPHVSFSLHAHAHGISFIQIM